MTTATQPVPESSDPSNDEQVRRLHDAIKSLTPQDAIEVIEDEDNKLIGRVLATLHPSYGFKILNRLPEQRSNEIAQSYRSPLGERWQETRKYPKESLGRLMEKAVCVFDEQTRAKDAVEGIRFLVKQKEPVTYAYVVDADQKLKGVIVLRDLMLAEPDQKITEVMIPNPFSLKPETAVSDAMQAMVRRHFPVYPVCDEQGRLIGSVKGYMLFEEHAFELSAQSGRMVGVEKEEMLATHWVTSLKFRHPWLQLNLLTAFVAAAVVGVFEDTIAQVVLLAVFLPVLAGQSGNTGCQSLAVTLRGMTLGHFKPGSMSKSVTKEAILGLANGALVGLTAGAAMFVYALITGNPSAFMLALVVFLAMVASCVISGISGVLVPTTLKRLGADPATASSIFLTTATDVASMGLFLFLATVLVL